MNILCLVQFGSCRNKLVQLLIRARNIFARTVRTLIYSLVPSRRSKQPQHT